MLFYRILHILGEKFYIQDKRALTGEFVHRDVHSLWKSMFVRIKKGWHNQRPPYHFRILNLCKQYVIQQVQFSKFSTVPQPHFSRGAIVLRALYQYVVFILENFR